MDIGRIVAGSLMNREVNRSAAYRGYAAPLVGYESKAGAQRFPQMLPFLGGADGDPEGQEECFRLLPTLKKPTHFFWGDSDSIFPAEQGREWAATVPGSTFDLMPNAGHFIQEDAGRAIIERVAAYVG